MKITGRPLPEMLTANVLEVTSDVGSKAVARLQVGEGDVLRRPGADRASGRRLSQRLLVVGGEPTLLERVLGGLGHSGDVRSRIAVSIEDGVAAREGAHHDRHLRKPAGG